MHITKTLISNFRRVLNVVCFLLGNSQTSEFYMRTFRNTLSVPSSQAGRCRMTRFEKCWSNYMEKVLARKQPETIGRRVTKQRRVRVQKQVVGGRYPPCHPNSYWLRLFSGQTFSRTNTPTFLKHSHPTYLSSYEDGKDRCFETSVYKIQTPGNYPEECIRHSEHDESLKSRKMNFFIVKPKVLENCKSLYPKPTAEQKMNY